MTEKLRTCSGFLAGSARLEGKIKTSRERDVRLSSSLKAAVTWLKEEKYFRTNILVIMILFYELNKTSLNFEALKF